MLAPTPKLSRLPLTGAPHIKENQPVSHAAALSAFSAQELWASLLIFFPPFLQFILVLQPPGCEARPTGPHGLAALPAAVSPGQLPILMEKGLLMNFHHSSLEDII